MDSSSPPSDADADADADAMQSAFQAFMLGTGGGDGGGGNQPASSNGTNKKNRKKKKKGSNPSPTKQAASQPDTPPSQQQQQQQQQRSVVAQQQQQQQQQQRQKIKKRYWQILNAFRKTLQEDWLEVDDHLGLVIASIVHLRDRIQIIDKQLVHCQQHKPSSSSTSTSSSSGGFGFRRTTTATRRRASDGVLGSLIQQDLELALSHGLIQHEKMLVGARKLISSLNQAQEALGRRLDELYIFHLEGEVAGSGKMRIEEEEDKELTWFAARVVDWCRQVYTGLADELYRKQCLVQTVVDSVNDRLLYQENDDLMDYNLDLGGDDADNSSPIKIAEQCLKNWPRGGGPKEDKKLYHVSDLLSSTPSF